MTLEAILEVARMLLFRDFRFTLFECEDRRGPWLALAAGFFVVASLFGATWLHKSMSFGQLLLVFLLTGIVASLGYVDFARWKKHRRSIEHPR